MTRDFPLLSIFAAASAAYKKQSDIFMSVGVFPGEMLLDPGATLAFGSTTAWHDLDQALHRVLGYGFTISPSCQQFRSANGKVDLAIQEFSIDFPMSVDGVYKMYRFQGSSVDCGKSSNAQAPILFPIKDICALGMIVDFYTCKATVRHLQHKEIHFRPCDSGHFVFSFVDLVNSAWTNFLQG